MTPDRWPYILQLKDAGTQSYARGEVGAAVHLYQEALDEVGNILQSSMGAKASLDTRAVAALFSNLSLCHVILEKYDLALVEAEAAIELEPLWAKGHYRRGSALLAAGERNHSINSLRRACELEPENNEMRVKLAEALEQAR
jgi:tetratricopeptide (TPR) repeat protein